MKFLILLLPLLISSLHASEIPDIDVLATQIIDPSVILLSATYGSGDSVSDVTDTVTELLKTNEEHYANPGDLKADPSPGWNKELVITYIENGSRFMFARGENGSFSIGLLKDFAEKKREAEATATP